MGLGLVTKDGLTLKEIRTSLGLRLRDVAKSCDVSIQAAQKWDHGMIPKPQKLRLLQNLMGVDFLVSDSDEKQGMPVLVSKISHIHTAFLIEAKKALDRGLLTDEDCLQMMLSWKKEP